MSEQVAGTHQLRSTLSLLKMQLQIGGYPKEVLLRELEEAITLIDGTEATPAAASDLPFRLERQVPVVVADDEPRLADVLARRLRREGLSTRSAHDLGAARLGAQMSGMTEVVILDLSLLENATVEERNWVAAVRPIVITGASSREVERLLDEIQPYAIVQKPFSSEQLASLARRRAVEEPA